MQKKFKIEPELEFNNVKFQMKTPMIQKLKFALKVEKSNLIGMQKIYESRYYKDKDFTEKNIINEKFKFSMLKEHYFIKIEIIYNIKIGKILKKKKSNYYFF